MTSTEISPALSPGRTSGLRKAGIAGIVGGLIAAIGATVSAVAPGAVPDTALSYPFPPRLFSGLEIVWTLTHVLTFICVLGVVRSGLAGTSRLATISGWISLVGMGLLIPAELGFAFLADDNVDSTGAMAFDTIIGIASVIAGLGLVLLGIAIVRTRRWQGWGRWTTLISGLFVFVALLPVQAIEPSWFLWPVAGWSATFVLLGAAMLGITSPAGNTNPR